MDVRGEMTQVPTLGQPFVSHGSRRPVIAATHKKAGRGEPVRLVE